MRKLVSILFALCLSVGAWSQSAYAEESERIVGQIEKIDRINKTILTIDGSEYQIDRNQRIRGPKDARVSNLRTGYRVEYSFRSMGQGAKPKIVYIKLLLD